MEGDQMDPSLERRTLAVEDRHWWFRGRRAIVLDAARRLARRRPVERILDAGCGGGGMLGRLSEHGAVTGIEPSPASRRRAQARGFGEVLDGRIGSLPFDEGEFDLILSLDVIEHIDDDEAALHDLHRVAAPGGRLLVTVPAHPRLWSEHDELNHHFRRYTRSSLAQVAERGGWRVLRMTHFNAFLLPVAAVAHKAAGNDGLGVPPAPLNRAMEGVLGLERRLISLGVRLPLGLSLIAELEAPPRAGRRIAEPVLGATVRPQREPVSAR